MMRLLTVQGVLRCHAFDTTIHTHKRPMTYPSHVVDRTQLSSNQQKTSTSDSLKFLPYIFISVSLFPRLAIL